MAERDGFENKRERYGILSLADSGIDMMQEECVKF